MAKRHKAPAKKYAPQTALDCANDIKTLGDLTRHFDRERADMNDAIAAISKKYGPILDGLTAQIRRLEEGIQIYCEAHRLQLTENGRTKTGNFVTGSVAWRQRPPSVTVRGTEAAIAALKLLELGKFIRTKEEINRDAILAEPDLVRDIPGITLVTGVEDFSIAPFEIEVSP